MAIQPDPIVSDAEPASPPTPRTRRAVVFGALAGIAGLAAGRLGRPDPAAAAAGSPLILGSEANNAGTANTQVIANSNVVTFKLLQQGPGTGLMGYATPTTGATRGVYGRVDSPNGDGVQGRNAGVTGTGAAVRGYGGMNDGILGTSDSPDRSGVVGLNVGVAAGVGIFGYAAGATIDHLGVYGESDGIGVEGASNAGLGVVGLTNGGDGVYGQADTGGTAIYGWNISGEMALYGDGDGAVTGSFSKAAGSFKIDHPLDPTNKWLFHSFVESPDMMNVYNGNATFGPNGETTIRLPEWFDALNRDFRYQLTSIGEHSPLFIKEEIRGNAFVIGGGAAGRRVSWQVTGVRRDAYADAHPVEVEVAKTGRDKGRYLHPTEHGQPASAGPEHRRIDRAPTGGRLRA
jgi:hypothetical protein